MSKILCVAGPTASGKTDLAIELALSLGGEVVSCDSMQVYRGMDIGTAKPTMDERRGVAHHLLDVADPWELYSVARYVQDAGDCIADIIRRGKLPIVCGGTGMYLDALIYGLHGAGGDEAIRAALELQDAGELHTELKTVDPASAMRIDPNDKRRIIRALEVYRATGVTITEHHRKSRENPVYNACVIGIRWERAALYARIDTRVDSMIAAGLFEEARRLKGMNPCRTCLQAVGYKEDGAAAIKQATRNLAKRQMTWFNAKSYVQWADAPNIFELATQIVKKCGLQ
ncbi:tRNA dimethylallyltransferase [Clostridia bacterium]|nr:tRNA dimethylallyltransferase [Clostridia bacterium]